MLFLIIARASCRRGVLCVCSLCRGVCLDARRWHFCSRVQGVELLAQPGPVAEQPTLFVVGTSKEEAGCVV